jgi:hypothetical protein
MLGKSHSRRGRTMSDVFSPERFPVEAKKMRPTHTTTGP